MLKEGQTVTTEGEEIEEVTIENSTNVSETTTKKKKKKKKKPANGNAEVDSTDAVKEEPTSEKVELPNNNGKINNEDENDEEEEEGEGEAATGETTNVAETNGSSITQQTEPPTIPVSKFFPDGKYPEGEICEYKN
ncbi:5009_t:CDS:2, partial [Scutellospora calospora]